ncbi:MAG: sugar phosphate isomerase/epimerase [archaeon]|nr:sugar phosphate isomerase/epimerase [archaeon]MCP8313280.1 sugar phosphate isomerase/epimerase [archaeon]MCP8319485.1 sugar phosphate isomerase/epimerase [archaeon]
MAIVGLSALYILLKGEPFENLIKDITSEREENENPDVWEIVDESNHSLTHKNLKSIQDLSSQGYSFTVHSPYSEINIADLDALRRRESLAKLKRSIDSAAKIEAKALVLHPGLKMKDQIVAERLNEESILTLYDYAESFGLTLALENMTSNTQYFMTKPIDFEEFLERTRIRLKIAFDIGHAHVGDLVNEFVSKLSDKFIIIHVHDNNGMRDEHLGIGDGSIDWDDFADQIMELDFRGIYIVESVEKPYESIARLREMLSPI